MSDRQIDGIKKLDPDEGAETDCTASRELSILASDKEPNPLREPIYHLQPVAASTDAAVLNGLKQPVVQAEAGCVAEHETVAQIMREQEEALRSQISASVQKDTFYADRVHFQYAYPDDFPPDAQRQIESLRKKANESLQAKSIDSFETWSKAKRVWLLELVSGAAGIFGTAASMKGWSANEVRKMFKDYTLKAAYAAEMTAPAVERFLQSDDWKTLDDALFPSVIRNRELPNTAENNQAPESNGSMQIITKRSLTFVRRERPGEIKSVGIGGPYEVPEWVRDSDTYVVAAPAGDVTESIEQSAPAHHAAESNEDEADPFVLAYEEIAAKSGATLAALKRKIAAPKKRVLYQDLEHTIWSAWQIRPDDVTVNHINHALHLLAQQSNGGVELDPVSCEAYGIDYPKLVTMMRASMLNAGDMSTGPRVPRKPDFRTSADPAGDLEEPGPLNEEPSVTGERGDGPADPNSATAAAHDQPDRGDGASGTQLQRRGLAPSNNQKVGDPDDEGTAAAREGSYSPPRRVPDVESSRARLDLVGTLARELATIKQDLAGYCTAESLRAKHPSFVLWEHLDPREIKELAEGIYFAPKAYAENLTLRKFGISSRETLKKDRRKLRRAEKIKRS